MIDQTADADEISGIVYNDEGATYESDGSRPALDKLVEWNDAGYLTDDVNALAQADAGADFRKGKALFFPAGSWNAAGHARQRRLLPDAAPQGGRQPRKSTGSFGYAWHVAAEQRQGRRRCRLPRLDVERERRPGLLQSW